MRGLQCAAALYPVSRSFTLSPLGGQPQRWRSRNIKGADVELPIQVSLIHDVTVGGRTDGERPSPERPTLYTGPAPQGGVGGEVGCQSGQWPFKSRSGLFFEVKDAFINTLYTTVVYFALFEYHYLTGYRFQHIVQCKICKNM